MPGVLFSTPFVFFVTWLLLRKELAGKRSVDLAALDQQCKIRKKETLLKVSCWWLLLTKLLVVVAGELALLTGGEIRMILSCDVPASQVCITIVVVMVLMLLSPVHGKDVACK